MTTKSTRRGHLNWNGLAKVLAALARSVLAVAKLVAVLKGWAPPK